MKIPTDPKYARLRSKSALDILRARIAEVYVVNDRLSALAARAEAESAVVTIPLWVAEELKQALEKQ